MKFCPLHKLGLAPLWAVFMAELTLLALIRLPNDLWFHWFAFSDSGAGLAGYRLLSDGLRPGLDFGYSYGLLPLSLSWLWYGVFGANPWSHLAAMYVTNAAIALGLARIAHFSRFSTPAILLLLAALPHAVKSTYPSIAHAIEAAFICHALAEQSLGRYSRAIVFATLALFTKASMAYFAGLVLVVLSILRVARRGRAGRFQTFLPAAATAIVLSVTFTLLFGLDPLIETLFPLSILSVYRESGYGFFGLPGRNFWMPEGANLFYYLGTVTGFWLLATVVTTTAAVRSARQVLKNRHVEILVTCVLLHLVFVFGLFGNTYSWVYYSYLLALAAALAVDVLPRTRIVAAVLATLAILGNKSTLTDYLSKWRDASPSEVTAGLWAVDEERDEWARVLETVKGGRPVAVSMGDGISLLFPEFQPPAVFYLYRGMVPPAALERKRAQIESASYLVIPRVPKHEKILEWPELAESLARFEPEWSGSYFSVLKRKSAI